MIVGLLALLRLRMKSSQQLPVAIVLINCVALCWAIRVGEVVTETEVETHDVQVGPWLLVSNYTAYNPNNMPSVWELDVLLHACTPNLGYLMVGGITLLGDISYPH